jgi:hypothetical protein
MAQTDRDVLFANEAFIVGMLQAVSGGAIVAAISQFEPMAKLAGRTSVLLFVSAGTAALVLALLAAYGRHQYKLWDVKAQASVAKGESAETIKRQRGTSIYLAATRYALAGALLALVFALAQFAVALWLFAPRS